MIPTINFKIVIGVFMIFISGISLVKGINQQANNSQLAGFLTMGFLMLSLGFYLVYRGLYPRK